jgi:hypothetical protein
MSVENYFKSISAGADITKESAEKAFSCRNFRGGALFGHLPAVAARRESLVGRKRLRTAILTWRLDYDQGDAGWFSFLHR